MTADDRPQVLQIARSLATWFQPLDQMALAIDLRQHDGLVALQDEHLVGFLTYHLVDAQHAELSWLGVSPETQAQGVGSRLLKALEEQLAAQGINYLQLNTVPADHNPNFAATNDFYLHHGFVIADRDENFYAHGRPGIKLVKVITTTDNQHSSTGNPEQ